MSHSRRIRATAPRIALGALALCVFACARSQDVPDAAARDLAPTGDDLSSTDNDGGGTDGPSVPAWRVSEAIDGTPGCVWGHGPASVYVSWGPPLGEVWHSTDQGATWSKAAFPDPTFRCLGMWGPSAGHAFMVGYGVHLGGALWETTDSGATWRSIITPEINAATVTCMVWSIAGLGQSMYVGVAEEPCSSSTVLHSADGGKTWNYCFPYGNNEPLSLDVAPSGRVWLGEARERTIYYSDDACAKSWMSMNTEAEGFADSRVRVAGNALFLLDSRILQPTQVRRSDDGGMTWVDKTPVVPDQPYNVLWALDDQHVWFGGNSGLLFQSDDGGDSWTKVFDDPRFDPGMMWASAPDDVYVLTQNTQNVGRLLHFH